MASKNPLDRAGAYAKNAAKEAKDFAKAWSKSLDATSARNDGPPSVRKVKQAQATTARNKQDKEMGQMLGAILQGRRYDKNGKQIKK